MNYKVSPADLEHLELNCQDPVKSALQNVALILATRKGTVPMYRDFGLDQKFLDKPLTAVRPMMIADMRENIERWEPRVEYSDCDFSAKDESLGSFQLFPEVEVSIVGSS